MTDTTSLSRLYAKQNLTGIPAQPDVLFIDDDLHILHSLGNVLRSFGYNVYCQDDSAQAIDLIKKRDFHLVLTDLKMQGSDGLDILAFVKEYQPLTPVIILTGYATLVSAIEALQRGAYDYLVKPCNLKEMQMTVERGIRQKKLKEERDHYFSELQVRNNELERTIEELVKAHEQLKEGEQFRDNMVSMFTHDLFNPITTIKGFVKIIHEDLKNEMTETHAQYFDIVLRNLKRIELLINSFQTFYKIDKHQYEITPKRIELGKIFRESLRNIELFALERQIQLATELPEEDIYILADPFELERALINIIFNAIKFSPDKGIVECSLKVERNSDDVPLCDAEKCAIIRIKDFGIGIPHDEQRVVFNKMYRASNSKPFKGTGLGLFITKTIVDLHNGEIRVDSTPGRGSLFTVTLPVEPETD